jgi:hypothetical protein
MDSRAEWGIVTVTITAIAVSIIATLVIADVRRWIPWIAERIVSRAARCFDSLNRQIKDEEYRANVQYAEGPLSMLLYAIFTYIKAPYRARELQGDIHNAEELVVEGSQRRILDPVGWQSDIDQSVAEYDQWYLAESPAIFAQAREHVVVEVTKAMQATDNFRAFDAVSLIVQPGALFVARMCVSPPMARDRFVGFSGVNKSLVTAMERDGVIPPEVRRLDTQLQVMCDFLRPLLDPGLFCWLEDDRVPTAEERDKALLVVGERLATASYLPVLRNAQEARQKWLMRAYLEAEGFEESLDPPFEMPPGTFGFGRNLPVIRDDGEPQNLPVDCVVSPLDKQLPLACVELKSAGDFTNVNKRRKEESDKHDALRRTHGGKAVLLLQLFGYFGRPYLGFEAEAGINWAWDHRLSDLAFYFGIKQA